MKRLSTKEILAESFKELARDRSIEKITIRQIAENCDYSPATFYRQFKDKYDLIAWDYAREIESTIDMIGTDGFTWQDALRETARCHEEHRDYLANLFLHTSGMYSFEQYMAEVSFRLIKRLTKEKTPELSLVEERCIWGYCYGEVRNIMDWILGRYDADAQTMAQIYEKAVPEVLNRYL